jgi:hypothetical protein
MLGGGLETLVPEKFGAFGLDGLVG